MKRIKSLVVVAAMMATLNAQAQKEQPAGIRMEIAEAETDRGEYSIFTYKDNDGTFGYYLGLGRVTHLLGAIRDDIVDMAFDSIKETCICLGATADEAFTTIDDILALYDRNVDTTVEFRSRAVNGSGRLGDVTMTICVVQKKLLGGKRLQFLFPVGQHHAEAFLGKSKLKELRTNFKIDRKLHPKQYR
ncbi:MAG: hypothetical protein II949_12930 [Prevotella sp.]|nr:hypothetical protein [Prevotella sp.]